MNETRLTLLDEGREVWFSFDEMVRYNGGRSPGGVALAFKALETTLAQFNGGAPVERRTISVRSAFPGPGIRDAFELATRSASDGRYVVDASLERPENGPQRARFVFEITCGDQTLTAALRPGFVPDEFLTMLALDHRSPEQEQRFSVIKAQLAERVMAAPGPAVFDLG